MSMPHSQIDFNIAVEMPPGTPQPAADESISIVGRTDWVDVENGQIVAVNDLKTVKNLWFIEKQGAKSDHYIQIMAYSWVFGTTKARIYYLDFGDLIVKEFDIKENKADQDKIVNELKDKARLLYKHIKEQKPIWPPAIDWKDKNEGWRCRPAYCPFTRKCHPDHPYLPENKKKRNNKQNMKYI